MVELATARVEEHCMPVVNGISFEVHDTSNNLDAAGHFGRINYELQQRADQQGPAVYEYLAKNGRDAGTSHEVMSATKQEAVQYFESFSRDIAAMQQQFANSRSTTTERTR